MRFVGQAEIARRLPLELAIRIIEDGFAAYDPASWDIPVRSSLALDAAHKIVLTMPLLARNTGRIHTKTVLVHTGSDSPGQAVATAVCAIWNASTGQLLLTADGTYLTAVRTAATTGAAARALARPDSSCVALIGAGYQGRMQALALRAVLPITRFEVVDINAQRALALAEELRQICGVEAATASTLATAVAHADVVVTATNSCKPVFPGNAIRPGTHVSSLGSYRTDMRETDDDFIARARIYVDAREHAWAEVGDLVTPLEHGIITRDAVVADLSELMRDRTLGRRSRSEITFFKSAGFALQDALLLEALYVAVENDACAQKATAG